MKTLWGRPLYIYLPSFLTWLAAVAYVGMALRYNPDPRLFPLLIGATLVALLPIDLLSLTETPAGRTVRRWLNPAPDAESDPDEEKRPLSTHVVSVGFVFMFAALLFLIGVLAAIPIYVAASVKVLGRRSWRLSIALAAILGISTYLLFVIALGIPLYPGVLFQLTP